MEVVLGTRRLFTVKVDEVDLDLATGFYWCINRGYAARPGTAPRLLKPLHDHMYLHRAIAERVFGSIEGYEVDHKDRDPLNNCRDNLRLVNSNQNKWNMTRPSHNTSGYKGVTWNKSKGKWVAQIKKDRKNKFLGHYLDPVEAARAYDRAALELFGEYACINFPGAYYGA